MVIEQSGDYNHPAHVGLTRALTDMAQACGVKTGATIRYSFTATDAAPVRARPAHSHDEMARLAQHPPHRPITVSGLRGGLVKGQLAPGKQGCLQKRLSEGWDSRYDEISTGDRSIKMVILVEFPPMPG